MAQPGFPALSENMLLAALLPADLALLQPYLKPVELPIRETLQRQEEAITAAYFPESGWTSNLLALGSGAVGEVGLVGREGMVGLPLVYGAERSPYEIIVQSPGWALRLEAQVLREALAESATLHALLMRYAMALHVQVSWKAICNLHHHVEQRLARWILMAHDRADGDEFPMTHEFLAIMLGVRRQGVTVAAGALQKARLIRYERGQMTILDRRRLTAASCECYRATQRECGHLLQAAVPC